MASLGEAGPFGKGGEDEDICIAMKVEKLLLGHAWKHGNRVANVCGERIKDTFLDLMCAGTTERERRVLVDEAG